MYMRSSTKRQATEILHANAIMLAIKASGESLADASMLLGSGSQ